jgi:glycerol-3-phosphate responsive antiterminator
MPADRPILIPVAVLPRVLVADGGLAPVRLPPSLDAGTLLRDLDLAQAVQRAAIHDAPMAIDLDSVHGLESDEAAADFVLDALHVGIAMTRRAHVAAHVSARGGLGLLHALAFDSTAVRRSLESTPLQAGVGTVISPGAVLIHMRPAERERLARPIVAYGLLTDPADVLECLDLAESVVLRPEVADAVAAVNAGLPRIRPSTLTRALTEE